MIWDHLLLPKYAYIQPSFPEYYGIAPTTHINSFWSASRSSMQTRCKHAHHISLISGLNIASHLNECLAFLHKTTDFVTAHIRAVKVEKAVEILHILQYRVLSCGKIYLHSFQGPQARLQWHDSLIRQRQILGLIFFVTIVFPPSFLAKINGATNEYHSFWRKRSTM